MNPKHFEGKPCPRCEGTLYYKSNKRCVSCVSRANARNGARPKRRIAEIYHGRPCRIHGDTVRYFANDRCVECTRQNTKRYHQNGGRAPLDKTKPSRTYRSEEPCRFCGGTERHHGSNRCDSCKWLNRRGLMIRRPMPTVIPYRAKKIGRPCRHCGTTEKYCSNGGCVVCTRRRAETSRTGERLPSARQE